MKWKMQTSAAARILIIFLFGLLVFGCNLFDFLNKTDNGGVGDGSYLNTNSTDPEFVKLVTDKGEIVNVFGTRASNGLPESVKQINIKTENGEEYSFYYDNNHRLKTAVANNGTVFNYEWLANNKVALTIICNDGVNQINTEIDLAGLKSGKITPVNYNAKIRNPEKVCYDIEFSPFTDELEKSTENNLKSATSGGTTYQLYTTSCGAPADQSIYRVSVYDQSGSVMLKGLSAEYVAKGHYTITVPSGTAPEIDPQAAVEKLTSILTQYCDAAGLVGGKTEQLILTSSACAYIAGKLALTGIGVTVAPTVGAACTGITTAMVIYCSTLGASGDPGTPSILDKINELKLLENFKLTGNMRLHVTFLGMPNNVTKGFTIAEGVSSTLTAEMSENAKPTIRSLDLYPSSPAANQDYQISVSVFCVPVGGTVSISMTGSDGYSDSKTYPVSDASLSSGKFTLTIPGAEKGVKDAITATVKTPDGQTITRSASLIFGN
ncbi:MAG: hypothetical protein Q8N05_10175 [Bacteroidota bacterium]|nr:hypothetical protein [Bacteroidota bacterium]